MCQYLVDIPILLFFLKSLLFLLFCLDHFLSSKPKLLPGQNGKRGKWAQNVLESASEVTQKTVQNLDQMKENLVGIHAAKNGVIELLSDDDEKIELIDENKVFSVKVKKEDIPKCWIEVYLQMPKNHGNDMKYIDAQQNLESHH